MSVIFELIQEAPRHFHDTTAQNFNILQTGGSVFTALSLIFSGFLYGVFHAAGPGHGKLIVASYIMADDTKLKNGLIITALSSLMQAVVAISLVLVLFFGFGLARTKTEMVAVWLEVASFALVSVIGAALVWQGIAALKHTHHCCNHHHEGHGHSTYQSMLAMTISIGIRPCSGGLLLMFFACLMNEIIAGVVATFAMAIGTGLTTSAIAIAAAQSRKGILKLLGRSEAKLKFVSSTIKILAGLSIVTIGLMLCVAVWPTGDVEQSRVLHPLMKQRVP
jgi:nickel/cobalt exporter